MNFRKNLCSAVAKDPIRVSDVVSTKHVVDLVTCNVLLQVCTQVNWMWVTVKHFNVMAPMLEFSSNLCRSSGYRYFERRRQLNCFVGMKKP